MLDDFMVKCHNFHKDTGSQTYDLRVCVNCAKETPKYRPNSQTSGFHGYETNTISEAIVFKSIPVIRNCV